MAPCDFEVTPDSYNRLYEQEFRERNEKVTFSDLERIRRKVRRWMTENSQHFPL